MPDERPFQTICKWNGIGTFDARSFRVIKESVAKQQGICGSSPLGIEGWILWLCKEADMTLLYLCNDVK